MSVTRRVRASLTPRTVLAVALATGALVRLGVAFTDDGIFWPDEIYQSLEPGHVLAFGYGLLPWEFVDGARNWTLPALIAAVMKASVFLGAGALGYLRTVHTIFVIASVITGWAVWRLARTLGADDWSAALAAWLLMSAAPAIYFAHRAMSENASALPIALGLWLTLDRVSSTRRIVAGSSLLGFATLLRLQSALFAAGAIAALALRTRQENRGNADQSRSTWIVATLVLGAWAIVYGATDAIGWHGLDGVRLGGWFHSAVTYVRFNAIEGRASDWGTAPAWFYVWTFLVSMPAVAVVVLGGAAMAIKRAPALVGIAVGVACVHALVPHKELRFLLPDWPPLFAAAGIGFSQIPARLRVVVLPGLAIVGLLSLAGYRSLTFGDLGGPQATPDHSAWDYGGPVNRLLRTAGTRPDVCGVRIDTLPLVLTGGSAYLHKKARLYGAAEVYRGQYNYAIIFARDGTDAVAREDTMTLVRVADHCTTRDPEYRWRLP